MQELTIYDIAKLAGVSITTVSRVLNKCDGVNPVTRARVEEIVREYRYVPRQSARNFYKKNQFMVGLLTDDTRHAYMSEVADAISRELAQHSCSTILCNIDNVEEEFLGQVDNLLDKKVDSVILLGSIFETDICKVALESRYSGYSFVTVNANFSLPNVCEIMQDQQQGMCTAIQHLYGLGRRRIGWIFYHRSHSDKNKYKGFMQGMALYGLSNERQIESNGKIWKRVGKLPGGYWSAGQILMPSSILVISWQWGAYSISMTGRSRFRIRLRWWALTTVLWQKDVIRP